MKISKKIIIIIFSLIIIVFGLAGAVPSFAGLYYVNKAKIEITNSTQILNTASTSINTINVMLDNSSSAMKNVSSTVSEAKNSLSTAAVMLEDTSRTMVEISKSIEFEILGYKPLEGVSQYFTSMSTDFKTLSGDMKNMASSVGNNIEDINNISEDLKNISVNLENFSETFSNTSTILPEFSLKTILLFIFSYFAAVNIIFILIGASLLIVSR